MIGLWEAGDRFWEDQSEVLPVASAGKEPKKGNFIVRLGI